MLLFSFKSSNTPLKPSRSEKLIRPGKKSAMPNCRELRPAFNAFEKL
jgi:hypothetical protein